MGRGTPDSLPATASWATTSRGSGAYTSTQPTEFSPSEREARASSSAFQHTGKDERVHVTAGQNDGDSSAAHLLFLLEERGECGRATTFGSVVGVGEQRAHRRFHFVV